MLGFSSQGTYAPDLLSLGSVRGRMLWLPRLGQMTWMAKAPGFTRDYTPVPSLVPKVWDFQNHSFTRQLVRL